MWTWSLNKCVVEIISAKPDHFFQGEWHFAWFMSYQKTTSKTIKKTKYQLYLRSFHQIPNYQQHSINHHPQHPQTSHIKRYTKHSPRFPTGGRAPRVPNVPRRRSGTPPCPGDPRRPWASGRARCRRRRRRRRRRRGATGDGRGRPNPSWDSSIDS